MLNRGYTWKQDLNRWRQMLLRMTVCSFFYAFGIEEIIYRRLHECGRKQGRDWIVGKLTRLGVLLRVVLLSNLKDTFQRLI